MIAIASQRLKRLLSDWEDRRSGRAFPSRADFTPFDLQYILGNVSLLDVAYDPLQFTYRLYATNLRERFGKELTGKNVDDISSQSHLKLAKKHFIQVIRERVPIVHVRDHELIVINAPHDCEVLVLPLSSDGKTIDMLMSAMVWDAE
jgi:hypothetical protein